MQCIAYGLAPGTCMQVGGDGNEVVRAYGRVWWVRECWGVEGGVCVSGWLWL